MGENNSPVDPQIKSCLTTYFEILGERVGSVDFYTEKGFERRQLNAIFVELTITKGDLRPTPKEWKGSVGTSIRRRREVFLSNNSSFQNDEEF